jgi:hypothetical protein
VVSRIWQPLSPTKSLFRAYRNESARNSKTGKPKLKAFFRREHELGLSVFLSKEAALLALNAAGLCTFLVADVHSCPYGLTLVQESEDHVEIRAVPFRAEDEKRAMDIADYLVSVSIDVPL